MKAIHYQRFAALLLLFIAVAGLGWNALAGADQRAIAEFLKSSSR